MTPGVQRNQRSPRHAVLCLVGVVAVCGAGCGSAARGPSSSIDATPVSQVQPTAQSSLEPVIREINDKNPPIASPPDVPGPVSVLDADVGAVGDVGESKTPAAKPTVVRPARAKPQPKRRAARRPKTKTPTPAAPTRTSDTLLSEQDRTAFAKLEATVGGTSGVAVARAGGGGVQQIGTLTGGTAWSTMKTAVAAATFTRTGGRPDGPTTALLRRAITASDNAAAEQLWSQLGSPQQAGALAGAELAAAGDAVTRVEVNRTRAGYTAFGQSSWSLADQVLFAARLPCTQSGASVLSLMGDVVADQRWGLGSAGVPARFKGGWGPDTSGRYLVRQMGILNIRGHQVAITLANRPSDGSFATGSRNLTTIARWVADHVNQRAAPVTPACS